MTKTHVKGGNHCTITVIDNKIIQITVNHRSSLEMHGYQNAQYHKAACKPTVNFTMANFLNNAPKVEGISPIKLYHIL